MSVTTPNTSSPPLPAREFRAGTRFVRWPGLLVLMNVAIIVALLSLHQKALTLRLVPLFGALAFAFLALFVTAATLRIAMDADGLSQRWLWGRRRIVWHEIASIERVRRGIAGVGLFLLDEKGKEIFAVSALPPADQQVIVDAALRYGRLRKDKKPAKRPIMERWVRK